MEDTIIELTYSKTFATRGGLPFSKKMWRDGYNKALQDIRNFIISKRQEGGSKDMLTPPDIESSVKFQPEKR